MKEVYYYSLSGFYRIGKVKKDYQPGDIFKLAKMRCKLKVIGDFKNNSYWCKKVIVVPAT